MDGAPAPFSQSPVPGAQVCLQSLRAQGQSSSSGQISSLTNLRPLVLTADAQIRPGHDGLDALNPGLTLLMNRSGFTPSQTPLMVGNRQSHDYAKPLTRPERTFFTISRDPLVLDHAILRP
jgi:hypothetical protein